MSKSVTEIIWEIYPFKWNFFQRALSYETLKDKALEPDSIAHSAMHLEADQVLRVLNTYGSFAHRMAKRISRWHDVTISDPLLKDIRLWLLDFFHTYRVKPILNEWTFTLPNEYGWTLDMLCEIEWKSVRRICVMDFKTWNLYRRIYGIGDYDIWPSTFQKKEKTVGLQLSMYANAVQKLRPEIFWDRGFILLAVHVTTDWIFPYETQYSLSQYESWKNLQSPN